MESAVNVLVERAMTTTSASAAAVTSEVSPPEIGADEASVLPDLLNIAASHHRHRRLSEGSVTPRSADTNKTNNSSGGRWTYNPTSSKRKSGSIGELEPHVLAGLTLAGIGATVLHTIHSYQVEQLQPLHHPPNSIASNPYSAGGVILKTTAYVVGAWWVDSYAAMRRGNRTDCIGLTGLALVAVFVLVHVVLQAPWLMPLRPQRPPYWMFECLRSIYILILASPVIEDHRMSPTARIYFMASGQCANLLTSLLVRWMCQTMFASISYTPSPLNGSLSFQGLLLVSLFVCGIFVVAQTHISTARSFSTWALRHVWTPLTRRKVKEHVEDDIVDESERTMEDDTVRAKLFPLNNTRRSWEWRRVARDLLHSPRFFVWLGMELWMEALIAIFHVYYLHHATILGANGLEAHGSAWGLVVTRKVVAILTYLPMLLGWGYTGVYRILFYTVGGLSALLLVAHFISIMGSADSVAFFLLIVTVAVHAAGFQLAMADLSLEIHYRQVIEGRLDEPSLAATLIGVNAVVCKPVAYLAAALVTSTHTSSNAIHVLTILPLLGSCVQMWLWRRYDLTPRRTATMRDELFRDGVGDLPR